MEQFLTKHRMVFSVLENKAVPDSAHFFLCTVNVTCTSDTLLECILGTMRIYTIRHIIYAHCNAYYHYWNARLIRANSDKNNE